MQKLTVTFSIVGFLGCLAGCHTAQVKHPLEPAMYGNDTDAQMNFWHTLETRKLATNNEAFHGLLLYMDSKDTCKTYQERVHLLKSRRMLPSKWNKPADAAVTRGTLSVAIAKDLKIKGGLMLHILPENERYATRELEYEGVYPTSSPNQLFSGAEFVGVIGKLDDYQHGVTKPVTNRLEE